jgi:hypothetical protein
LASKATDRARDGETGDAHYLFAQGSARRPERTLRQQRSIDRTHTSMHPQRSAQQDRVLLGRTWAPIRRHSRPADAIPTLPHRLRSPHIRFSGAPPRQGTGAPPARESASAFRLPSLVRSSIPPLLSVPFGSCPPCGSCLGFFAGVAIQLVPPAPAASGAAGDQPPGDRHTMPQPGAHSRHLRATRTAKVAAPKGCPAVEAKCGG